MRTGLTVLKTLAAVVALIALFPALGFAQSSIAGVAKDDTGGVLPGVTVEAASPALIERTRSVVSDDQGQYKIVDLRPGVYTVTFSLQGFNTFKRDGVTLQANTVATVNGAMKVGSLEETITVTGEAPLVDVQSSVKQQTVNRELLDQLPTGRQMWGVGTALPGIVTSGQDVGGSGGIQQSKVSAHGADVNQTVAQVDGMELNTMIANGSALPYFNDGMAQEMSFQTSAMGAETSAGGVRVNIIPKEGGNTFHGATFFGTIPNSSFSSNNLTDDLCTRGLCNAPKVLVLRDFNQSIGGPVVKDKLWFFSSYRYLLGNNTIAGAYYANGNPAIDDNKLRQGMTRLTFRASENNKIALYYDLMRKFRGHDSVSAGTDEIAGIVRPNTSQRNQQAKWTSTVTPRMMLESGVSANLGTYYQVYEPGVAQVRNSPAWFAMASRQDTILGTRHVAAGPETWHHPSRYTLSSSVAFITGSHAIKTGYQWGFGGYRQERDLNADLVQVYKNGVPDSVTVYNAPVQSLPFMKADLGIYAQDSWTRKRMTLNYGLRFEYFNSYIKAQDAPAGRFVPARHFDPIYVPILKDLSPRVGVAYDLFGDGRTAVKASVSKYVSQFTTDYANGYNPMFLATDSRKWTDLNGDDIAQNNEIGPSNNSAFGIRQSEFADPNLKREYNIESTLSLQRQLTRTLSASVGYYRRGFHRLQTTDNLLVSPSDYTAVTTPNPLGGDPLTVYNLNPAKQGQVNIVDINNTGNKKQTYNGIEATAEMRTPGNGRIIAGLTHDRTVNKNCSLDDPNNGSNGRFCDQTTLSIPFRNMFKLSGSYPLPYGVQLSGVFTSFPQAQQAVNYSVGRTQIPSLTQTSVTVPLIAPGTKFLPQWNQLDFGFAKVVGLKAGQNVRLQLDLFNILNSNVVTSQNQSYGPSLDKVQGILQGRVVRLAAQFHF
jgi:hypothetical protein